MLSIVVPLRDESFAITGVIEEICHVLGPREFELICVDDGSRDETRSVLYGLEQRYAQLRVLVHDEPLGQTAAVRSGVAAARGEYIVTLDGDGQNDPNDIPRLVQELSATPAAMVVGWRFFRRDPWYKRIASSVANATYRFMLKDSTQDVGCGLKAFRRAAFLELPFFDHMHRFLPALIKSRGGEVVSVVVNHRPRRGGSSKYGVWDRLWVGVIDLIGVRWLIARSTQTRAPLAGRASERSEPGLEPTDEVVETRAYLSS